MANEEFFAVAEASSFEELVRVMPDVGLPKDTPFRIVMDLKLPVARAFDLAGAEFIFAPVIPPGLALTDVHSSGDWTVVVETKADPAWLVPIAAFLAQHWLGLSLVAIGILFLLGELVALIKGEVPITTQFLRALPETAKWLVIGGGIVALVALIGLLATKKEMPAGGQ